MAQRDLTVRLRADIGQYRQAMADASKSTGQVARAGQALQNAGGRIASVGDNLTKKVTVPLALAGAAAVKMAGDFDSTFTQMTTLAGVSAGEVDGLKDSVLDLAGETGKAPQELAEALYFLRSSGLDASGAMDALEVSAKASAAGLGDTVVLADAVSSAMMAYADAGLTAADATDVLVATARAGKAEPSELAGQLGRLIPISAELGISFADVGGAVAALSTKGNDAAMASTQLLGVMSKLLKPSQQAAEQLDEVGLSTDAIRQMIADKGLLGTLEELQARLGDNGFIKFLEDQQAVQGGLALLGGDLEATKGIFEDVNEAAGATNEAFATWAESMGAENAQAWAKFQAALIRVGDSLAPIAADVANFIGDIADAFNGLDDGKQQAILWAAAVIAAIGPVLSIGGRVVQVVGMMTKAWATLPNLAVPAGTIEGAFNGAAVATSRFSMALGTLTKATLVISALIALREVLGTVGDEVDKASMSKLENDLIRLAETGKMTGSELRRIFGRDMFGGAGGFGHGEMLQTREDLEALDEALAKLAARDPEAAAQAFRRIKDELRDQGAAAEVVQGSFDSYEAALAEADTTQRTTASAVEEGTAAIDEQAGAYEEATSSLQGYIDALAAQFDPLFAMASAMQSNREAQDQLRESQEALTVAQRDHGASSAEAAEAQGAVDRAMLNAAESAVGLESAAANLTRAMQEEGLSADAARQELIRMAIGAGYTEGEAEDLAAMLGFTTGEADRLASRRPNVHVSETGTASTVARLNMVEKGAEGIPGRRNVHASASGTDDARNRLAGVRDAANSIPASKTIWVEAKLRDLTFGWLGSSGKRAMGGPVLSGRLYEVAEQGRAELLEMAGRTYLIPGSDGTVVPAGGLAAAGISAAAAPAGGGLTITGNVTVIANDPQALVDGLVRWSRNNGPLPVRVRG